MAPGVIIEYAAVERRQDVYWVRHTDSLGTIAEFAKDRRNSNDDIEHEIRTMDCLDCHTRPSHGFQLPERALDEAIALGVVDSTLPWIKKLGLQVLDTEYDGAEAAAERIPTILADSYRTEYPLIFESRREAIESSAAGLAAIYGRNIFPEMGVTWGTYPDNSGHSDFVGCFRCHGAGLHTPDGESITADCGVCHKVLALKEQDPEILDQLGLNR
jgi:hypothetical protein